MLHIFPLYLFLLLKALYLFGIQSQNVIVNSSINITYSDTCLIENSSSVAADLRCIILCQKVLCQALNFEQATNSCNITYPQPNLIKYISLDNLNIRYFLSKISLFIFVCNFKTLNICLFKKTAILMVDKHVFSTSHVT